MTETLRTMERVKQFRETRERMSEAALAMVTANLREAEARLEAARRAEEDEAERLAQKLHTVSRSRAMSSAMMQAFGMDSKRREGERSQFAHKVAEAQSDLRARRMESEQVVALYKKEHEAVLGQVERRSHSETVDRFLARSRWSSTKVRVRSLTEAA